jgi:hypothetical protein
MEAGYITRNHDFLWNSHLWNAFPTNRPQNARMVGFTVKKCMDQVDDKREVFTNDNSDTHGMQVDSLHKIRPMLNILRATLSRYAVLGSEHLFDEGSMAC